MIRIILILNICFCSSHTIFSQENNPFSIYHGEDTVAVTDIVPISPAIAEDIKLQGDNPFSLSHIPIRKNQYEKIESLKAIQSDNVKETISISNLPLWVASFSLCLLAYMLYYKRSHVNVILRSLLNDNYMRMTSYDENSGRSVPYLIGYIIFIINVSLFIYMLLQNVFDVNSNYLLVKTLGVLSLFFIGKHLVGAFFAYIYNYNKESENYHFLIITMRNLLGIIFLVLNIIFVFGSHGWYKVIGMIGLIIFLIFLLSRYYKGIKIARTYINSHFFQFFIYFCAFELAPWVIVYKMVNDLF